MKIVLFYHSLLSDWNHGNAHFLRGIATELIQRGNKVTIYEPQDSWSLKNLLSEHGQSAINDFHTYYPLLNSIRYSSSLDLSEALAEADLVIVHEWNDHKLVKQIGEEKKRAGFKLLFHDTHHRIVTENESMRNYDLSNYDGVLAYGEVIRQLYLKDGWAKRAWTWHEAADTNVFKPVDTTLAAGDLVWIGNWGDDERTKELHEFLIQPVKKLGLKAKIYGVRYPAEALSALQDAGIEYGGWLPNYKVPEVFSTYRLTVHVPRGPYVMSLPGIPTIRPFEALACGIPMVSSPWNDSENLFTVAKDFEMVNSGEEMTKTIYRLLKDEQACTELTTHGLHTIHEKHTCSHRVDELFSICDELGITNYSTQRIAS